MKITFEQHKGNRLYKQFIWITNNSNLWWCKKENKWLKNPKYSNSNCKSCKTIKAFKRHLKKHPEIRGKAILVSRYIGYDAFG